MLRLRDNLLFNTVRALRYFNLGVKLGGLEYNEEELEQLIHTFNKKSCSPFSDYDQNRVLMAKLSPAKQEIKQFLLEDIMDNGKHWKIDNYEQIIATLVHTIDEFIIGETEFDEEFIIRIQAHFVLFIYPRFHQIYYDQIIHGDSHNYGVEYYEVPIMTELNPHLIPSTSNENTLSAKAKADKLSHWSSGQRHEELKAHKKATTNNSIQWDQYILGGFLVGVLAICKLAFTLIGHEDKVTNIHKTNGSLVAWNTTGSREADNSGWTQVVVALAFLLAVYIIFRCISKR